MTSRSLIYRLDEAAFRLHVLNADWMVAAMDERGEAIKAEAEATAPVYEQGPHPGRYRDAFSVESGADGGPHHDRAYAIVSNSAPEALSAEFGTENNVAHHTLLRALSVVGQPKGIAVGRNVPRE